MCGLIAAGRAEAGVDIFTDGFGVGVRMVGIPSGPAIPVELATPAAT